MSGQLESMGDPDADFQEALLAKEEFLLSCQDELARQLLTVQDQRASLSSYKREILEAVAAGEKALMNLERAESALRSARGWGIWDLLGGGLIVTYAKHSRMDDAASTSTRPSRTWNGSVESSLTSRSSGPAWRWLALSALPTSSSTALSSTG